MEYERTVMMICEVVRKWVNGVKVVKWWMRWCNYVDSFGVRA